MVDVSGYVVAAEVVYGNNGSSGTPEMFAGTEGDMTGAQVVWDSNPSDGFDSGWVPVKLHVTAGEGEGDVTWDIYSGGTTVTYSSNNYGNLSGVAIVAGVTGPGMYMAWQSLKVIYYYQGEMVDSLRIGTANWPVASTLGQTSGYGFQDDYYIEPSDSCADEVIVTGYVRMKTDSAVYPSADAMAAQIFILPEA